MTPLTFALLYVTILALAIKIDRELARRRKEKRDMVGPCSERRWWRCQRCNTRALRVLTRRPSPCMHCGGELRLCGRDMTPLVSVNPSIRLPAEICRAWLALSVRERGAIVRAWYEKTSPDRGLPPGLAQPADLPVGSDSCEPNPPALPEPPRTPT